ncbi:MAG: hypothetical protein Q4G71_07790 [Pseudomonadota bacterium]|nr:hypothetical protein [Pseudomonadota bacterium]
MSLTDNLPQGMVVAPTPDASLTPAACAVAPASIQAVAGATSVGVTGATLPADTTCYLRVTVVSEAVGNLINTVPPGRLRSASGLSNTGVAEATVTTAGDGDVGVVIARTGATLQAGQGTEYTVTVTNHGNMLAGAQLSNAAPAGITYGSWTCTAAAPTVCPAASGTGDLNALRVTLPVDGEMVFTIDATVDAGVASGTQIENVATIVVDGAVNETDTTNNRSTTSDPVNAPTGGELGVVINGPAGPLTPGGNTQYTVVVSNNGTVDVPNGATLTNNAPPGLSYGNWVCTATGNAVCPPDGTGNLADVPLNLPAGGTLTFTIDTAVGAGAAPARRSTTPPPSPCPPGCKATTPPTTPAPLRPLSWLVQAVAAGAASLPCPPPARRPCCCSAC